MPSLMEILSKTHKDHKKEEKKGEHHKVEHRHKEKGKEKEKSKFKYPEMSIKDVQSKIDSGYSFRAAKDSDYKDDAVSKNIVTIKLDKMGYTPFVMVSPPGGDGSDGSAPTAKPMSVQGDPDNKKEESTSTDKKEVPAVPPKDLNKNKGTEKEAKEDFVQMQHPITKQWQKLSLRTGRIVKMTKDEKPFKDTPIYDKEKHGKKEETTSAAMFDNEKRRAGEGKLMRHVSKKYDELWKHHDKVNKKDAKPEHIAEFKKKSDELLKEVRMAQKVIKDPVSQDKLKDDIVKGIRKMDESFKKGKSK